MLIKPSRLLREPGGAESCPHLCSESRRTTDARELAAVAEIRLQLQDALRSFPRFVKLAEL
jgi:hypothetical protein